MPKKFLSGLLILPLLFLLALVAVPSVSAKTECLDKDYYEEHTAECDKLLNTTSEKLQKARDQQSTINSQIKDYLSKLSVTDAQLTELKNNIQKVQDQLTEIEKNLNDRKGSLSEKTQIRNKLVRAFYQTGRPSIVETLFASSDGEGSNQSFVMRDIFEDRLATDAVKSIISLNIEIANFEKDKKEAAELRADLEASQRQLLTLKADIDAKKQAAQSTYKDLEEKSQDYEETIAKLSALQESILAAKSGDFSASLSSGVETDDPRSSPNYNPGPGTHFAAFSYGAYTHRNGMSQYGAKGRAEDGQTYEDILKFYYKTGVDESDGLDDKKICVQGVGDAIKMKDYLKGLGEMPPSWDEDALKAQAVAARTYAYRYTKSGKCICTTTSCQYYSSSLVNRSDRQRWYDAITNTKDEILVGNVSAQYSSTTGGWINNVGWDKDGSWPNDAYEKKAGSPWFFKAWFTKDYSTNSSTCSLDNPWLDSEEMADILNAYMLIKAGKDTDRILPETIGKCSVGGMGGDPYSRSDMRSKSEKYGGGFSKVTGVNTPTFNSGYTSQITFTADGESITVDGQLFMKAFNLRAPGYIAIKYTPDSKGLFSILKK